MTPQPNTKENAKAKGRPQGKSISVHLKDVFAERNTSRWTIVEKDQLVEVANDLCELLLARIDGQDIDQDVLKCHSRAAKIAAYEGTAVTGRSVLNEAVGRYCSHILRGLAP